MFDKRGLHSFSLLRFSCIGSAFERTSRSDMIVTPVCCHGGFRVLSLCRHCEVYEGTTDDCNLSLPGCRPGGVIVMSL